MFIQETIPNPTRCSRRQHLAHSILRYLRVQTAKRKYKTTFSLDSSPQYLHVLTAKKIYKMTLRDCQGF